MSLAAAIDWAKFSEFAHKEIAALHPGGPKDTPANWVSPFVKFCEARGERSCPALPQTVAAWVDHIQAFQPSSFILDTLLAVELLHDYFNYANPVATAKVRNATGKLVEFVPPRSWSNDDRELLRTVSPSVQSIIARRESERDKALRRIQSELDRARQELKRLQAGTEKPAELKEENTNASDNQQRQPVAG